MQVNRELVDKLAELARLSFTEAEKDAFVIEFQKVLGFVEKLDEVDTQGREPLQYITDEVNVLREDVVTGQLTKEDALKNAPLRDSDYFKVPTVLNT